MWKLILVIENDQPFYYLKILKIFMENHEEDSQEIPEEVKALVIPDELKDKVIDNLSDYKKIKRISGGSFGFVYKIKRKSDSSIFAGKFSKETLRPPDEEETDYNKGKYFRIEEFILMAKLDYPALLKLIAFCPINFANEPYPTIILPFMVNGTVKDFLKTQSRTNTKVYIILLGTAIGMRHLQSLGIAHRDLKPENVLLDQNFYPHVADFGSSKSVEDAILSTQIGTPIFLAPEIVEIGQYGIEVDVYSFAIMAYCLLTGQQPYPTSGFTYQKIIKGERPKTENIVSPYVKNFLEKAWNGNPSERPTFDEIINMMTDKRFIESYSPIIDEVIKYLEIFGEEFVEIQQNLKHVFESNPEFQYSKYKNETEDDYCSSSVDYSESYENALGLTPKEVRQILSIIKVSEDVFNHWCETYQQNSSTKNEKRAEQIEFMITETNYPRRVVELAYDYLISSNSLDDTQVMFIASSFNSVEVEK